VMLLTIEALDVTNFGEYLTPEVALAVPEAAAMILQQINNLNKEVLTSSSSQVSGKST
jgi:Ni,Fe-hydrogenase maturation factor